MGISRIPGMEGMEFEAPTPPGASESVSLLDENTPKFKDTPIGARGELPPPVMKLDEKVQTALQIWIDQWILDLESSQADLQTAWANQEDAYRALPGLDNDFQPFEGASNETIPVGAMAVDPIFARLDTGIFKQDPVIVLKAHRKDLEPFAPSFEKFLNFYLKNKIKFRNVAQPRLLEFVKLGTMVFKVIFDREEYDVMKYSPDYKQVVKTRETRFAGPRLVGVHLGDALFPPFYESVQDCPIFIERQRTTYEKLKTLEAAGRLANVDKVKNQQTVGERTKIEDARERDNKHALRSYYENEIKVYETWCDFSLAPAQMPSHLCVTYEKETRTFLQIRLNWYFHQKKPYALAPYQIANDTMYGFGIMEMIKPLQDAITRWHRMAQDNAYLANIRMFIVRRNSGIEEVPRLYAGRCFFVDDPTKDFIPFASGDTYPSTLAERQNLFGLAEKRTGVSDYLTGRESPIIGSRATATSTLALIREGLSRVEEVLENIRVCFNEIVEFIVSLWIQYGTGGLEDVVYGEGDKVATDVKEFLKRITQENINGAFAVDLSVTDTTNNRQAQQQMQLALIQIMMQYLEKVLAAGQGAIQAIQQGVPEYAEMVKDVMTAAREMFRDLAEKYDVVDPEKYLPDLARYIDGTLNRAQGEGSGAGAEGQPGGPAGGSSVSPSNGPARAPAVPRPPTPGSGGERNVSKALAGAGVSTA